MKTILLKLVRYYQYLTFSRPNCCRFYPSCSEYAAQTLQIKPWPHALFLIVCRLVKCSPWHSGGVDLPPNTEMNHAQS